MSLLQIDRPTRKVIQPIIATKISPEIQAAFDQLAIDKYNCTRAELMRACVLDCLKRHGVKIK
tara:strand:- start:334 stop:522 length:189 start_codon:yes stop_codon:yes gene_type:complete